MARACLTHLSKVFCHYRPPLCFSKKFFLFCGCCAFFSDKKSVKFFACFCAFVSQNFQKLCPSFFFLFQKYSGREGEGCKKKIFLVKVGPLSVGYPLPREVDPPVGGGVHGALPVVLLDQDPDVDLVAGAQALQGAQGRGGEQVVVLACVGWAGSEKKGEKGKRKERNGGDSTEKRKKTDRAQKFACFSKLFKRNNLSKSRVPFFPCKPN